jgi:D-glycero-D-manno-heptose 1,7-bisphosphate phosphatase
MKKKVVFLDRDGIVNIERGEYTYRKEDFHLVPDILSAAHVFSDAGYAIILISNQGGISKGIYTKEDVLALDNIIRDSFVQKGINVLDSFYCPHYSDNENCLCRKPKSLLLERAIAKHDVDKNHSFFIGDSERDKIAGEQVGIRSLKVVANSSILEISKLLINE